MHKILFVLLALLIVFYASFWFYAASRVRHDTEAFIAQLNQRYQPTGGAFTYQKIRVQGFPARFVVQILGANLQYKDRLAPITLEYGPIDKISLKSNLLQTRYTIALPREIAFKRMKGEEAINRALLRFNESPLIKLTLDTPGLFKTFEQRIENIKALELVYEDKGASLVDTESGKIIRTGSNSLKISGHGESKEGQLNELKMDISLSLKDYLQGEGYVDYMAKSFEGQNFNPDLTNDFSQLQNDIKKMDFGIDLGIQIAQKSAPSYGNPDTMPQVEPLEKSAHLELKKLGFTTNMFSLSMNGRLDAESQKTLPTGNALIDVKDYQRFVRYIISYLNVLIDMRKNSAGSVQMPVRLDYITPEFEGKIVDFLASIGTPSADGKDLTLILKKEEGGSLYIGSQTLEQLMAATMGKGEETQPEMTAPPSLPAPVEE